MLLPLFTLHRRSDANVSVVSVSFANRWALLAGVLAAGLLGLRLLGRHPYRIERRCYLSFFDARSFGMLRVDRWTCVFRVSTFSAFRFCGLLEQTSLFVHNFLCQSLVVHICCLWDLPSLRLRRLVGSVPGAVFGYLPSVSAVLVFAPAYPQRFTTMEARFGILYAGSCSGLQYRLLRGVAVCCGADADLREGTRFHVGLDRRL